MDQVGEIKSILGDIIEVAFFEGKPSRHELLTLSDDASVKLEVYSSTPKDTVYCLSFTDPSKLYRGAKVQRLFSPITVPVGPELLGRVVNVFGEPLDNKGKLL